MKKIIILILILSSISSYLFSINNDKDECSICLDVLTRNEQGGIIGSNDVTLLVCLH